MTFDQAMSIFIVAWFVFACVYIWSDIHRIGAGGPAEQEHLGVPKTAGQGDDGDTGAERGGSATNCGTRAAPHHDPRVTILARSRPYDQDDAA